MASVNASRGPLFRIDAGWLFVAAGLIVCASVVLLPAQRTLHELRQQLDVLRAEETTVNARLGAYADFLDDLERGDADLMQRLAAAQLNLVSAGKRPVLLISSPTSDVTDWIDATVPPVEMARASPAESMLSRLACGPFRHWVCAAGGLCVFIGLMLGPCEPSASRTSRRRGAEGRGARAEPAETPAAGGPAIAPPWAASLEEDDAPAQPDDEPVVTIEVVVDEAPTLVDEDMDEAETVLRDRAAADSPVTPSAEDDGFAAGRSGGIVSPGAGEAHEADETGLLFDVDATSTDAQSSPSDSAGEAAEISAVDAADRIAAVEAAGSEVMVDGDEEEQDEDGAYGEDERADAELEVDEIEEEIDEAELTDEEGAEEEDAEECEYEDDEEDEEEDELEEDGEYEYVYEYAYVDEAPDSDEEYEVVETGEEDVPVIDVSDDSGESDGEDAEAREEEAAGR